MVCMGQLRGCGLKVLGYSVDVEDDCMNVGYCESQITESLIYY